MRIPTIDDVAAAAKRLRGHAVVTPLLRSPLLDEITGGTLLLKAETLQIGGAFKFRGAYNRLSQLSPGERARGVVAWSSGNHAQGVAAAGYRLGVQSTIVMPSDAPRIKIDNTRRLGADIVFYERHKESREEIGHRLARERGATLVPSYDDPDIIAGQGTVGLELSSQAQDQYGASLDAVLVPCGGGGLMAGCALALAIAAPAAELYSVEPVGFDDTARSLASKSPQHSVAGAQTLCDALTAPTPGELTFQINRERLSGGLAVTDELVLQAIAFAWCELKLVVEPGGAVALAAVLGGLHECKGKTVGIVLSGGNVESTVYTRALTQ